MYPACVQHVLRMSSQYFGYVINLFLAYAPTCFFMLTFFDLVYFTFVALTCSRKRNGGSCPSHRHCPPINMPRPCKYPADCCVDAAACGAACEQMREVVRRCPISSATIGDWFRYGSTTRLKCVAPSIWERTRNMRLPNKLGTNEKTQTYSIHLCIIVVSKLVLYELARRSVTTVLARITVTA